MKQSYKELEVYRESFELHLLIHKASMQLPKYELYELGSQVRRSSDSTVSNIVEGYGRRKYKNEFIRFLIFSHASCMETSCHLERISILYPDLKGLLENIMTKNEILSRKLHNFISFVIKNWESNP